MYDLHTATIELTRRCNAKCIHCIVNAGEPLDCEMQSDRIFSLIEELCDEGCKDIIFTGGEVLLRKEWPLFVQKAVSLGMQPALMTNGLLIDDEVIKTLKLFNVALGISLDGHIPEIHNKIRGVPGIFEHLVAIIPKLKKAGIYVAIPTTVMQSNYEYLDKIRDLLIKLKVDAWQIQILKPCDRAPNEEILSEEQYYNLAKKIVEYRKKYSKKLAIIEADCIGYHSSLSPNLYNSEWRGCECGIHNVSIESNGLVKGCPNMSAYEGNVADKPFSEIWRNHDSFKYNRKPSVDNLSGFCASCEHKYICRGGCPANPKTLKTNSAYCLHKIESIGVD